MDESIKFLQFFRKFQHTIGICGGQLNQKYRQTWPKTIVMILCAQFTFATAAFFVLQAKSMFDYGFAFYNLITLLNGFILYTIFVWQSENTLKFIESCERFIGKSE